MFRKLGLGDDAISSGGPVPVNYPMYTVEKLLDSFFVNANFKKEPKIELAHEKTFLRPYFYNYRCLH